MTMIERAKASLGRREQGYACAECGVWGPYRQYHSGLFCLLHKRGWTRQQIVAAIREAAEATKNESADA